MPIICRRHAKYAVFLFVAGLALPGTLRGQDSLCAPIDAAGRNLLVFGAVLASDSTAEIVSTRELYGILPVPESEVEIVSDEETCTRASTLLHADLEYSGQLRPVTVVRIGTRYIIVDPAYENPASEWTPHIVCDDEFRVLARFAG